MKMLIGILVVVVVVLIVFMQWQYRDKPQQETLPRKASDIANRPFLKQFVTLTPADFAQYPVWVNVHVIDYGKEWYNETDEETFRPWDGMLPADPSETMFLVKSNLTLADGTVFSGFITPQQGSGQPDLGTIQPYLFTKSGELISFWFGIIQPARKEIDGIYEKLGKSSKDVFPIQFQAEDGMAKGVVQGVIPGFCRRGTNNEVIVER